MARSFVFLFALMGLMSAAPLARALDVPDPDLHVDPSLEDCSVQFAPELTQAAFRRFAREFGSVSAFKSMSPPTSLGKGRVVLGLEYIAFTVEEKADAWNDTFAHPDSYHELGSNKAFPKARVRAGITDRLDVGAFYTRNPNANYGWLGLEVRYGMLQQSQTMPLSLGLRGAYTRTLYVSDMDMHTITTEVAVARTLWSRVTPYVGLGNDLVLVRETADAVELDNEVQAVPSSIAGLEVRFWHFLVGAEGHWADLAAFQVHLAAAF